MRELQVRGDSAIPLKCLSNTVMIGYLAFYAGKADACYIGEEKVTPQPGGYYGGWVRTNLVGPIKGERGTEGW